MKYNPIGSTFTEGEHTLQVMASQDQGRTCTGCWYTGYKGTRSNKIRNYPHGCYVHGHACTPSNRKDREFVVFTKINN